MKLNIIEFRLGPHRLGMDVGGITEVVSLKKVMPVPEMPDYIPGVLNVRGDLVPLVDMRVRFGLVPSREKERAILIRSSLGRVGLVVDSLTGIVAVDEDEIRKPPVMFRGLKKKYLLGLTGHGGGIMILLNIDHVLTSEEEILLKQARDRVREKVN